MENKENKFYFDLDHNNANVVVEWSYPKFDNKIYNLFNECFDNCIIENRKARILFGDFLLNLNAIREFLKLWSDLSKIVIISQKLQNFINNVPRYNAVTEEPFILDKQKIKEKLKKEGFERELLPYQLTNVSRLIQYPGSASFSVPGAGKTTEALAYYTIKRNSDTSRLLIISPINAFTAWDEEIPGCFKKYKGDENFQVTRLRDDYSENKKLLNMNKQFYIVNYEKVRKDPSFIKLMTEEFSDQDKEYFVILDESHKMKGFQTGRQVNLLSPLIKNKLILTGTPMPQAYSDLIPQFRFLYPRENFDNHEELAEKFQPIFVRTTKDDIGLPPAKETIVNVELSGVQKDIYETLVRNELIKNYDFSTKESIRAFKINIMRMLQFCSNPGLQHKYIENIDPKLASLLEDSSEINGLKMSKLLEDADKLCSDSNEKLVIWSSFPKNIDIICEKLSHHNPVAVHGQISTEIREKNIKDFQNDPDFMIFVANPAAAAEGISLHKVCRNAFYLDRSYNAAHYLQSKDRIHRIGSDPDKDINIKIYQLGKDTIDHRVNLRLSKKIDTMAEFLNDHSIKINPNIINNVDVYDKERTLEERENDYQNDFIEDDIDDEDVIEMYNFMRNKYGK